MLMLAERALQGDDVLCLNRQIAVNLLVQIRRPFHTRVELALEPGLFHLRRRVVTMRRGESRRS